MRAPAVGVGDGMVHIAVHRRSVAARRAAGQVPAAHKVRKFDRGRIPLLGGVSGRAQRHQPGGLGQLGNHRGRNEFVVTDDHTRRGPSALHAGLLGDHVDHHIAARRPYRGAAARASAATHQPVRAGRQRPQSIGAALLAGAGVGVADGDGQLVQPPVQCQAHRVEHPAIQPGHARLVGDDVDMATLDGIGSPAHRVAIHLRHLAVHRRGQPTPGNRRTP